MNGQPLVYSIPEYLTFLFYEDEKPEGTMYQIMKIFAEFMDFNAVLLGAPNFIASIKMLKKEMLESELAHQAFSKYD